MVSQNHPLSYLAHILNSNLVGANTTTNPVFFYIPTVQQLQGIAALTNWVPGEGVSLSCQVHTYLYYGTYLLHMNLCHSHDDELCSARGELGNSDGPQPQLGFGQLRPSTALGGAGERMCVFITKMWQQEPHSHVWWRPMLCGQYMMITGNLPDWMEPRC